MCKNPHEVSGSLEEIKRFLGIDRLVLQVHASSFPVNENEDLGRGTPYGQAAEKLLAFASRLGFDAIQLGPMGLTERGNPSPYNAAIFSRNPMDLPLMRLLEQGRISSDAADAVRAAAQKTDGKNRYAAAYDACEQLAPVRTAALRHSGTSRPTPHGWSRMHFTNRYASNTAPGGGATGIERSRALSINVFLIRRPGWKPRRRKGWLTCVCDTPGQLKIMP